MKVDYLNLVEIIIHGNFIKLRFVKICTNFYYEKSTVILKDLIFIIMNC